ncbi:MAG: ATP-dependent DNA helicase RecG, partial [Chloroflexota bacterium]
MPSALETLVKILKLERDQGYNNTAVIGGLQAFEKSWTVSAHQQARIEMHHLLVDDLSQLMATYEEIEHKTERHDVISYMLDRIMMRVQQPREDFVPRNNWETETNASPPPKPKRPKQERKPKPKQKPEPRRVEKPRSVAPRNEDSGGLEAEFVGGGPVGELDIILEPRLDSPPRKPRGEIDLEEQADRMHGLLADVTAIKGIGKSMAGKLAGLKSGRGRPIETVIDMLEAYPRRYDDYTKMRPIAKLEPGSIATVIGTVRSAHVRAGANGRRDFVFNLDDGTAQMLIVMFGQHWMRSRVRNGDQIVVSGKVTIYRDKLQMSNAEWEPLDGENLHTTGIVPVYRLTDGLKARRLRNLMKSAVDFWSERMPDPVPESVLERADLADLGWSLTNVHFPKGFDHLGHARRRLTFDDLLLMQLGLLQGRYEWQSVPAAKLEVSIDWLRTFLAEVFPYEFTGAQRRTVNEILDDVKLDVPMNRLVQGDVGSGKTAVSITALAIAFANDKQAAFMAPTSILAEQHFAGVSEALAKTPGTLKPKVALLTGSMAKADRDAVYAGVADGSIDVVVGTHALFQRNVEFYDLGLVVVDEQHRFGAGQRGALRGKGTNPHFLEMTATPIPRALALVNFANLDISVMDEMPPGRTPVKTSVRHQVEREHCYDFIKTHLENGRQAFIVHPLVEASESIDAPAAVDNFDHLSEVFYEYKVGLLHG